MPVLNRIPPRVALAALFAVTALLVSASLAAPPARAIGIGPSGYYSFGDSDCNEGSRTDPVGVLFYGTKAWAANASGQIQRHAEWGVHGVTDTYLKVLTAGGDYECRRDNTQNATAEEGPVSRSHVRLWFIPASGPKEYKTVGTPHYDRYRITDCYKHYVPEYMEWNFHGGEWPNQHGSGFDFAREYLARSFEKDGYTPRGEVWGNTWPTHQCVGEASSNGWGALIKLGNAMRAYTSNGLSGASSSTLAGTLETEEPTTEWWFAYGTSPSQGPGGYPYKTAVHTGSSTGTFNVNEVVSGLGPNLIYARLFARNPEGEIAEGNEAQYSTIAVGTGGVAGFPPHEAIVTGTVNPNGITTNYHFEFGTTTAYGGSSALYPAGSGTAPIPVSAPLRNLAPGTLYHYRIISENSNGKGVGEDKTFTTPYWPPLISAESPSELKAGHGKLNASINPQDSSTHYHFEWGKASEGFPNSAPIPDADIGSGTSAVKVSQEITGLKGLTEYQWRVIATNVEGTVGSPTQSFTTPDWRPSSTTETPVYVRGGHATFRGDVNPNGFDAHYHFAWGDQAEYEAGEYNHAAPIPDEGVGSGESAVAVQQTVEGLKGLTTYHYVIVAENAQGAKQSEDLSFTTPDWRPGIYGVSAVAIETEEATLVALINPKGFATHYHFAWGDQAEYEAGEYNHAAPVPDEDIGSGEEGIEVSAVVEGLTPGAAYHYRLIAENTEGSHTQGSYSFRTGSGRFKGSAYPITVKGVPTEQQFVFGMGGGVALSCTGPEFEAQLHKGAELYENGADVLDATPTSLFSCSTGGLGYFEFEMNGCHFEIEPGYGAGSSFDGELDIGPPGCGPVTVSSFFCDVTIPPQIGRHLTIRNGGVGGGAEVTIELNASKLRLDRDGLCGHGYTAEGSLSGAWKLHGPANTGVWVVPYDAGPGVSTEAATGLHGTEATLNATVDPKGEETVASFEYGTTTAYGQGAFGDLIPAGEEGPVAISKTITGLKRDTLYHYRVLAANYPTEEGSYGEDRTFDLHAPEFEAGRYPASVSGSQPSTVFALGQGIVISCPSSGLSGELGKWDADLGLDAEYAEGKSKCTFPPLGSASVAMNGCRYRLHAYDLEPPYKGSLAIACEEEGGGIQVKGPLGCTVTIPAQSLGGLAALKGEGSGESAALTVDTTGLGALQYSVSEGCEAIGITAGEGTLGGPLSLAAQDGAAQSTAIAVGGEEEPAGLRIAGEAPAFEADGGPALLLGSQPSTVLRSAGAGFVVSCSSRLIGGRLGEPASSLSLDAEYAEGGKGCTLSPLGKTAVATNGCHYRLGLDGGEPPYTGGFAIECPKPGDAIEIGPVLGCTLKLPAQSPAGAVAYENEGEGDTAKVVADLSEANLAYTTEGCSGIFPPAGEDGALGAMTLRGSAW